MRRIAHFAFAALCIAVPIAAASAEDSATPTNPPSQINFQVGHVEYRLPIDLPDQAGIMRALPALDVDETIQRTECELISYQQRPARHFPRIGTASMHSANYRCTVTSDQRTIVVYMDFDRLVLAE